MKTLSKRIVVIGSLCCLIVLSLLFLWSRNNKKTLTEEFKIADFYDKETKSFQFRDISFDGQCGQIPSGSALPS